MNYVGVNIIDVAFVKRVRDFVGSGQQSYVHVHFRIYVIEIIVLRSFHTAGSSTT